MEKGKELKMDSKEVSKHLQVAFYENYPYQTLNFHRCGYHEADVFMVAKSNLLVTEIEVKISLSNFKADFKKTFKHKRLSEVRTNVYGQLNWILPSWFYYACPYGLIPLDLIPDYAGLIYVKEDGSIEYQKGAPKLHKTQIRMNALMGLIENLTAHRIFGCQWMTHQTRLQNARWEQLEAERKEKTRQFIEHAKNLKQSKLNLS